MTPNEVFWWTLGLTALGVVVFIGGMTIVVTSRRRSSSMLMVGTLLCVSTVFVSMGIESISEQYPADTVFAAYDYSKSERDKMRAENDTIKRLRPVMRQYIVVCPDPELYAEGDKAVAEDWNSYYSSFLQPAPLGPNCYYHNNPLHVGIEKSRHDH